MKGKHYSIPVGMTFKTHYCCHCGAKLVKEKTYRLVSKDDKDYYNYQDYCTFPRNDHDVYDYRYKCPSCNTRITYKEQCIIKRIQKKCKSKILSESDIRNNYRYFKEKEKRKNKSESFVIPVLFNMLFFGLFYLLRTNKTIEDLLKVIIIFLIFTIITVLTLNRRYEGKNKLRKNQCYSIEHEELMEKLHCYSANNKKLIDISDKCYCYHCKSEINPQDIKEYIEAGTTAICPNCRVSAIIPDSVDDDITLEVITNMNEYWY